MKIPRSVRETYDQVRPVYEEMKAAVDARIGSLRSPRWHYVSRIKAEESYAQKLETSREPDPSSPEDLLACTLVVENHAAVQVAEGKVLAEFPLKERRPKDPKRTGLASESFGFDDLRLYVSWKDDPGQPPTRFNGRVFEVQVKTFLQHAWGIATHDLIYKSDGVNWGKSRVAFQVKAMLENAELCISEVQGLTASSMLDRSDSDTAVVDETIRAVRARWTEAERLPTDLVRLAQNLIQVSKRCKVSMADIWATVDQATATGRGAQLIDLSPYAAVLDALIASRGAVLFSGLSAQRKLFVPSEVALPADLPPAQKAFVISATPPA